MLHHTRPFIEATHAELERFFAASDARGGTKPHALRRLTAQIRAVARAHRVPPHEVEDVVQTTWLRLLEHGDSIREPRALGAWLHTTARRESLRIMRGLARTQPTDPADLPEECAPDPDLDSPLMTAEVSAALGQAIGALPKRQRLVMRMLLREPAASYTEVSRVLGMPIGSIGPTRARALERLRQDARLSALAWQDGLG